MPWLRSAIMELALANPVYAGAKVTAYGVTAAGAKDVAAFVMLYDAIEGGNEVANPQTLDDQGKWAAPVYAEQPCILDIRPRLAANHDTGVIRPAQVISGTGSPEGAVTAPVGIIYLRDDGGAGTTLYVKESGTGNTGWAAK